MEYEPSIEGLAVQVERREQLTELLRDIARLPEDQRAALLLAQLGDPAARRRWRWSSRCRPTRSRR